MKSDPFVWRAEARCLKTSDMSLLGIPRRYWPRTVGELPEDCLHKRDVLAYVEALKQNVEEGKGLLLYGLPGRGKTSVACAILKEAWMHGIPGRFVSAMEFDREAIGERRFWDDQAQGGTGILVRTKVLVVDDVRSTLGEPGQGLLTRILRKRADELLPTLVTTNLSLRGMEELLGGADWSLVSEVMKPVLVEGPNWRELNS